MVRKFFFNLFGKFSSNNILINLLEIFDETTFPAMSNISTACSRVTVGKVFKKFL